MNVRLAYGKHGLKVELPDDADITILEPRYVEGLPEPEQAVRQALQEPTAGPPLNERIRPGQSVGIIFSDITRPVPNQILIPALLEALKETPPEFITLYNATGTHRPNTALELDTMLGEKIARNYRIIQNDASDLESHRSIGLTRTGNDMLIHRQLLEEDALILTGFIEPHFFAGFSGGGKAVLPGMAHLSTVLRNHNAANMDNPRATWGVTAGNPIWEEVNEAVEQIRPAFLLNVALNKDKQITAVFSGDAQAAHAAGCTFVRQTAMAPVEDPFDIVITSNSGYPLDLNLYQSVKGMSAAAQIVKPGGSIIIAADCWDGVPDHGAFAEILTGADSPGQLLAMLRSPGYLRQDMWQAQILALLREKAEIHVYSENLTDSQIQEAMLIPSTSVSDTVSTLRKRYGAAARICILPEGPQTIPYIA